MGAPGRTRLHVLAIILFGLLVYSGAMPAPFHFDDNLNIVENIRLEKLEYITTYFTHIVGPLSQRPLVAMTFAIDRALWGLRPAPYRVENLLIHITNALLLYFLLNALLSRAAPGWGPARESAFAASLIFTVHPLQTEAVTYIVTRSSLMAGMFYLSGMLLFLRAAEARRASTAYSFAMLIVSLSGMACRESFATFPAVLLLVDHVFVARGDYRGMAARWRLHLPAWIALAYVFYLAAGTDSYQGGAGMGIKTFAPLTYLLTQMRVHVTYLRLIPLPINQVLDYDYPAVGSLYPPAFIASALGYAALWAMGAWHSFKARPAGFAVLAFMVMLTPASSIVPLDDVIFEHRLYLPLACFSALLSCALFIAARNFRGGSTIALPAALVLCLALGAAAYARNSVWLSGESIWGDVVSKAPNKARGYINLASSFLEKGDHRAAAPYAERALDLAPDNAGPHITIATVYIMEGNAPKAEEHLLRGIELNPSLTKAYNILGRLQAGQGRYGQALENFRKVLSYNDFDADAHFYVANIHMVQKNPAMAEAHYLKAIAIYPGYSEAHYMLGLLYRDRGKKERSDRHLKLSGMQ